MAMLGDHIKILIRDKGQDKSQTPVPFCYFEPLVFCGPTGNNLANLCTWRRQSSLVAAGQWISHSPCMHLNGHNSQAVAFSHAVENVWTDTAKVSL